MCLIIIDVLTLNQKYTFYLVLSFMIHYRMSSGLSEVASVPITSDNREFTVFGLNKIPLCFYIFLYINSTYPYNYYYHHAKEILEKYIEN